MKKLRKLAILIFAVLFAVPFTTQASPAPREQLSIPGNPRIEAGNMLRWDSVPGATSYTIGLNADWLWLHHTASTNYINLQNIFNISAILNPSQSVRFDIVAHASGYDSSGAGVLNWTTPGTQPPYAHLPTPSNIHVDTGNVLRWNQTAGAATYVVIMRFGEGSSVHRLTVNNFLNLQDSLDISTILTPGQIVEFAVVAFAPGFLQSPEGTLTWIMPGDATPQPPAYDTWHVNITGSWAGTGNSGQGNHRAGQVVTINAGHRPEHEFIGWRVHHPSNLNLANMQGRSTTFTMPRANVHIEAVWWPIGQPMPDAPWWWLGNDWRDINWNIITQHRNPGGVSFNYGASNFPETLAVADGSTVNLQLRVQRHLAPAGSTFMGQWLRNGILHSANFPITLNSAGFAEVNLSIPSVTSNTVGEYALRVTTVVGGVVAHTDTSRVAAISIGDGVQGEAATWPRETNLPQLPAVNPIPTPRPHLAIAPDTPPPPTFASIPAAPGHNHDTIMNNTENGSVVLQMLPGTDVIHLHGRTLDAMIDSGTTLFVVNDLAWTVMPPEFLAHLRHRGGNMIGPNGGTFNVSIRETHGGETIVTAHIEISTTINGQTRPLTNFTAPYAIAIEMGDFGIADANPNHIAVLHAGNRLTSHVNGETGLLSFNVMTTGDFGVNYIID